MGDEGGCACDGHGHDSQPLYNDYRKLRVRNGEGTFQLSHVDEFVDEMLTKDFLCNIALPRIPTRWTLEASTRLEPRISALEDFEEELEVRVFESSLVRQLLSDSHTSSASIHRWPASPQPSLDCRRRRRALSTKQRY